MLSSVCSQVVPGSGLLDFTACDSHGWLNVTCHIYQSESNYMLSLVCTCPYISICIFFTPYMIKATHSLNMSNYLLFLTYLVYI